MSAKPITLDTQNLPDDLSLLKSLVVDLVAELNNTREDVDRLRQQLHLAIQRHYGRKSETVSADQMALFQKVIEEQLAQAPKPPVVEPVLVPPTQGHGRRKPPKNLPVKVELYPLPDNKKTCPDCGGGLKKIGEEKRHIIDYIPASVFVREQVAEKFACGSCQGNVVQSEFPGKPIERGMAGAGLLAQVVISKFADHLPMYRQAEIFTRQGFEVNRSTLCDFSAQVAELLTPIYDAMKAEVLQSKVIHSDDTPVPVLDSSSAKEPPGEKGNADADNPQGPKKARLGRLWVWVGDAGHAHTVFDYTPDRKREGPVAFLKGWKGYLQADAYAGYDTLYAKCGVVEVACWAHARRKFNDAKSVDKERVQVALAFIGRLYEVERAAKEMDAKARQQSRMEHSKPVLEAFKTWLDAQALIALPKSATGEAIGYALRQWSALCRYLDDGDLNIDNNAAENALRCVALGRKNWLFAGSDAGGQRAAVLYSLIASCKRHGINPFTYLNDIIGRVATHPQSKIHDLLPAYWTAPLVAA